MSELKIDNPAQRLLDILEEGKQYDRTEKCRQARKTILSITNKNEQMPGSYRNSPVTAPIPAS